MMNGFLLILHLSSGVAAASASALDGPLACQPNSEQPMLPTFHVIGNVTVNPDKSINLEPINDCSGVTVRKEYH